MSRAAAAGRATGVRGGEEGHRTQEAVTYKDKQGGGHIVVYVGLRYVMQKKAAGLK